MKIKLKTGGEAQTSAATRMMHLQSYLCLSNTVRYQILMVLLHPRQHTGATMQAQLALNHQTDSMRIPTLIPRGMFRLERHKKKNFAIPCPHIAKPSPIRPTPLHIVKMSKHPTHRTMSTRKRLHDIILMTEE
jgi:hypothetical protein